jgi:hypothetical protein
MDGNMNNILIRDVQIRHWKIISIVLFLWAFVIILMLLPSNHVIGSIKDYISLIVAYLASFVTIGVTWFFRRSDMEPWIGKGRLSWTLIGCGLFLWALGDSFWQYTIASSGHSQYPSLADIGFASSGLVMLCGLIVLPSARQSARQWLFLILDSFIITGSLFALAWYIIVGLLVQRDTNDLVKIFSLFYPTIDVLLLSFVAFLLMRGRSQIYQAIARWVSLWLLCLGLCCIAIADFNFNIQQGLAVSSLDFLDIGWPIGMLTIALGAYLRCAIPASSPLLVEQCIRTTCKRKFSGLVRSFPYILLAVHFIVLSANVLSDSSLQIKLRPVLLAVTLIVITLVMVRQAITSYDNAVLARRQAIALEELARIKRQIELQAKAMEKKNAEILFGIEHLKGVQARLANGNWWVRSTLTGGDLLPLSTSLNLMADRLQHLVAAEENAQSLWVALSDLVVALVRHHAGGPLVVSASTSEIPQIRYLLSMLALPGANKQASSEINMLPTVNREHSQGSESQK